jgi:hypothetical protein
MTTDAFVQTGGCHCGGLRYTITQRPLAVYACHCTDCQSLTGTAFGLAVLVPAAAFTLAGTPRLIPRVLGSGLVSQRSICPECGVWVCGGSKADVVTRGEKRVVRGGTLDDTSWLRPTTHYWTRSAQPWIVFPEGVTRYETQP